MDRIPEPADNKEPKGQGLGGDAVEQTGETANTDELSDIPKVSYGSKCKAVQLYNNTLRYHL